MSRFVDPTIVLVMPCFNGEKYLEKSLSAFFAQDYENKKVVVVDGKSTDASHEIISKFVELGYPIIWDKTKDTGISSAINIGIQNLKKGEIFGYLGADDILLPGTLSDVASLMRVASQCDGVYFDSYGYDALSGSLKYRRCPTAEFSIKNLLRYGTIVGLQNIYIRSENIINERFSEKYKCSMDYELYIRLAKKGNANFTWVPKASTINIMDGNISTNFMVAGAIEAINGAVSHLGYTPRIVARILFLKLVSLKNKLLK